MNLDRRSLNAMKPHLAGLALAFAAFRAGA
jgi:hypothetical protein